MAGGAFEHGSAYCTEDFMAASLWLPPEVHSDVEAMGGLAHESHPRKRSGKDLLVHGANGRVSPHRATLVPAAHSRGPGATGEGLGSALLMHALEISDRDKLPAYLEATSPHNRRLYERHGFEAIGEIQAADSPPMWPMLRKPR